MKCIATLVILKMAKNERLGLLNVFKWFLNILYIFSTILSQFHRVIVLCFINQWIMLVFRM